jgi:endoglucanase
MTTSVSAPTVVPPGPAPPRLTVRTDRGFAEVEVAIDPILFNGANRARRGPANFFSSAASPPLPVAGGQLVWTLDAAAWTRLYRYPYVYYRALGYDGTRAAPRRPEWTIPDAEYPRAPAMLIAPPNPAPMPRRLSGRLAWLRVLGNRVVDPAGRTVVLRGVNRSGLEYTDRGSLNPEGRARPTSREAAGITQDEINEIVRRWRANVIRLPINQEWALTRADYLAGVDRVIEWAAAAGAYTLLDLQWFDTRRAFGHDARQQPIHVPPMPEENSVRMWRALAARYRHEPAVLYDIFNEPHEPVADDTDFLFQPRPDEAGWVDMWHTWVRRIEAAIHRQHPRALLFVSGWDWARNLRHAPVPRAGEPLPGAVYSFHAYPHNASGPAQFEHYFGFPRLRSAHPIFAGEWGGDDGDLPWGRQLDAYLRDRHRWAGAAWQGLAGWTAWSWADIPLLVRRSERTRPRQGQPPLTWRGFDRDADGHPLPTPFGTLVRAALAMGGPLWDPATGAARPVLPVRPQLTLIGGVGAARANPADDVRAVQDRLVNLRYLDPTDRDAERPAAAGPVSAAALARTIAAIRRLQTELLGAAAADGAVDPGGGTLAALNRAIPRPTAAEYAAVAAARNALTLTTTRGLTLTGRVGNVPAAQVTAGTANRPADVRAVQTRLVEIGALDAGHGEAPPAGATASVPAGSLPQTRAAIRAFQRRDVAFWRNQGVVAGAVTNEVVAPADPTGQLLGIIATHRISVPSAGDVLFARDHPVSQFMVNRFGTSYPGTIAPASLPDQEWAAAGLTTAQSRALRFISQHEGDFDALNTFDGQRVSLGFIQFAGSFGLRPFLALLRSREPATFDAALRRYGIDVEFNVVDGTIANPTIVLLDPAGGGTVLRATAALTGMRDDPRLWAVLVHAAGRLASQRVQVEAAVRDYLLPSQAAEASLEIEVLDVLSAPGGDVQQRYVGWAARNFRGTPQYAVLLAAGRVDAHSDRSAVNVGALCASEQGLAVLLDRAVQEGAGSGAGVARVVGAARWVADRQGVADIAGVAAHERQVLAQVADDFSADIDIADRLDEATAALRRVRDRALAAGADLATLLADADLVAARRAVDRAIAAVPRKSFITTVASARWIRRSTFEARLPTERRALDFATPPASPAALATALDQSATRLAALRPPQSVAVSMRNRINPIIDPASPLAAPP